MPVVSPIPSTGNRQDRLLLLSVPLDDPEISAAMHQVRQVKHSAATNSAQTSRYHETSLRVMVAAAIFTLSVHLVWIILVIFGSLWTRGRPVWTALHILALLWGIAVEAGPWPCPLTLAEQYFETRAGLTAYQGSFLLHYLDAIVYPNLPDWLITVVGVVVCAFNLGIYAWRLRRARQQSDPH